MTECHKLLTVKLTVPAASAQFHKAAKHNNYDICFALIKTGLQTKLPLDFQGKLKTAEYQYNKQYATNGNLVCNPVFIKK